MTLEAPFPHNAMCFCMKPTQVGLLDELNQLLRTPICHVLYCCLAA